MLVPRFEGESLDTCLEALGAHREVAYIVGNVDELTAVWPFDIQPGSNGHIINKAMQADFSGPFVREAFLIESSLSEPAQRTRDLDVNELVLFCGIVQEDLGVVHPEVVRGMVRYSSELVSEGLHSLHLMHGHLRRLIAGSKNENNGSQTAG